MIIKIFALVFYTLFIYLFLKVPDHFWDYILERYRKVLTFLVSQKRKLPVWGMLSLGEELKASFANHEVAMNNGLKSFATTLPRYKFYTLLVEQLFELHRSLGVGIKKTLPDIRKNLSRDLVFERKIFSEMIASLLQFLVITSTTWCFVFLSRALVDLPLNPLIAFSMVSLQVVGLCLFFIVIKMTKEKTFLPFSQSIKEMYQFCVLLEVGLSLNDVLDRSSILKGGFVEAKKFMNYSTRMKNLIVRLKETGLSPLVETKEIIGEIWQLQEEEFLTFTKKVAVLKFVILAIFFLPAYFLYLYSIFQFFMEQ